MHAAIAAGGGVLVVLFGRRLKSRAFTRCIDRRDLFLNSSFKSFLLICMFMKPLARSAE